MKQLGKFLAVVAIFGLLVFGIDRLGGFVLSKTIKFGEDAKLKHALNGSSDDMIILGSSRAYHHYNSLLLQKELNLTTYNYGEGGQNIYFYYAEMNMIRSHMPKIVLCELFDIDYTQTPSAWNTDKLSVLYPEYFANDSVRSIIDLQGKNTALKMRLSHLYPYNSRCFESLKNMVFHKPDTLRGYMPLDGLWSKTIAEDTTTVQPDIRKIQYLTRLADFCRANNIRFIVAVSPKFARIPNTDLKRTVLGLLKRHGAATLDFEQDSTFTAHPEYFRDVLHLNSVGAEAYSHTIADTLKTLLPDAV